MRVVRAQRDDRTHWQCSVAGTRRSRGWPRSPRSNSVVQRDLLSPLSGPLEIHLNRGELAEARPPRSRASNATSTHSAEPPGSQARTIAVASAIAPARAAAASPRPLDRRRASPSSRDAHVSSAYADQGAKHAVAARASRPRSRSANHAQAAGAPRRVVEARSRYASSSPLSSSPSGTRSAGRVLPASDPVCSTSRFAAAAAQFRDSRASRSASHVVHLEHGECAHRHAGRPERRCARSLADATRDLRGGSGRRRGSSGSTRFDPGPSQRSGPDGVSAGPPLGVVLTDGRVAAHSTRVWSGVSEPGSTRYGRELIESEREKSADPMSAHPPNPSTMPSIGGMNVPTKITASTATVNGTTNAKRSIPQYTRE